MSLHVFASLPLKVQFYFFGNFIFVAHLSKQTTFPNISHLHLQLFWSFVEILKIDLLSSEEECDDIEDEYSDEVAL
jgi:hypothetical protein